MIGRWRIGLWVILLGSFLELKAAEIKLNGSTSVERNFLALHQEKIEEQSGHRLKISSHGSLQGIRDLISDEADIAMISSPLETLLEIVTSEERRKIIDANLQVYPIGSTRVVFIVHETNPIKALTLKQIAGILKGRFRNWGDFDGKDQVITVVLEKTGGGARTLVLKELLQGRTTSAFLHEVDVVTEVPEITSRAVNVLGITSKGYAYPSVNVVATDNILEQPLFLVTKSSPPKDIQAIVQQAKILSASPRK